MRKTHPNVVILCRVSTEAQDNSRQVLELRKVCEEKNWNVVSVIENKESGMKKNLVGLEEVRKLAEAGRIQKVVVSEISRIARRLSVVASFVEEMEELKVSIYSHNQNLETLQENGERNGVANIFLAAFAEIARNEREVTVQRIKSGLDACRRAGKTLGRPKGTTKSPDKFLAERKRILEHLKSGHLTMREIAKLEKVSFSTIYKVKNIFHKS